MLFKKVELWIFVYSLFRLSYTYTEIFIKNGCLEPQFNQTIQHSREQSCRKWCMCLYLCKVFRVFARREGVSQSFTPSWPSLSQLFIFYVTFAMILAQQKSRSLPRLRLCGAHLAEHCMPLALSCSPLTNGRLSGENMFLRNFIRPAAHRPLIA